MVVVFVVGFWATVQMAATNTIIQSRVPDELRGRIMAVYATMFMGVQPIGSLLAGGIAKRIGAAHTLGIFGLLGLIGGLVFLFRVGVGLGRPVEATAARTDERMMSSLCRKLGQEERAIRLGSGGVRGGGP